MRIEIWRGMAHCGRNTYGGFNHKGWWRCIRIAGDVWAWFFWPQEEKPSDFETINPNHYGF